MVTCWECDNCGWQVLDPPLELGSAACLCGVGAGRWRVSTARLPRAVADGGEIPIPLKPSPTETLDVGSGTRTPMPEVTWRPADRQPIQPSIGEAADVAAELSIGEAADVAAELADALEWLRALRKAGRRP